MVLLRHVLCFAVVLGLTLSAGDKEQSVHINFRYPLIIDTSTGMFEGRICASMKQDAPIPVEPDEPEPEGACELELDKLYLKIEIRNVSWPQSSQYNEPTAGPERETTNTITNPPGEQEQNEAPTPAISEPIDLPAGVVFDVTTDMIGVNSAYGLMASKPRELGAQTEIQFYVVLVTSDTHKVVSNPVPFIVRVEQPPDIAPHGAAMFAGILLLAIIFIALLIPITVCVKRRRKAGKSVCTCPGGSTEDVVNKDEGTGHVNDGYIREPKDTKSISSDSSDDPKQTIGSHQLRTVSDFHFQPTWLNPHFQELDIIPERPSIPEVIVVQEECRL